jgi:hypothetical protein
MEYNKLIENLADRGILVPIEFTGYNNPRKYAMPIEIFDELKELDKEYKEKLRYVFKSHKRNR